MNSRKSIILAGTTALALLTGGAAAHAQDIFSGMYFSGGLGANFLDEMTVDPGPFVPRILDFDTGFVGSVALGTRINPFLRVEGELSYRDNDLDTVQAEGPAFSVGGDASTFAVMLNGWFDIPVALGNVSPYVGGGVGGADVSIESDSGGGCCVFDGSDFVFSYQLGAGVAIGAAGGRQVTLDYRYFHADEVDSFSGFANAGSSDYEAHSLMIGFRLPIGRAN